MNLKQLSLVVTCALALSVASVGEALASPMLLNRGLPTANLNNAAGSGRSNVAWVDAPYTSATDYWLIGDSFTNTSAQTWYIDTIRLWTVGATSTAVLWGGVDNQTIGIVSSVGTISGPVTYADASTYQGSGGGYLDMYQVDFGVNLALASGATYDFFLDGTSGGTYVIPFVHSSNAALSGSPQDGANGVLLEANVNGSAGTVISTDSFTTLNNGWDKASDVNVQVFGNAVPEPATWALVPLALFGLFFGRRRRA